MNENEKNDVDDETCVPFASASVEICCRETSLHTRCHTQKILVKSTVVNRTYRMRDQEDECRKAENARRTKTSRKKKFENESIFKSAFRVRQWREAQQEIPCEQ